MNPKVFLYGLLGVALLVLAIMRFSKSNHSVAAAEEQAVIVKLKLGSELSGSEEETSRIAKMEDHLAELIKRSSSGDLDGDEYGDGFCTIYMYGPSAERLFVSIKAALIEFHASPGSYVIKRYGKPGAKQDRLPLDH